MDSHLTAAAIQSEPATTALTDTAIALAWGDRYDLLDLTAQEQRSTIAAILFMPRSADGELLADRERTV